MKIPQLNRTPFTALILKKKRLLDVFLPENGNNRRPIQQDIPIIFSSLLSSKEVACAQNLHVPDVGAPES